MKPIIFYLYKITNEISGKIYIGQTINPVKRWKKHRYEARREKPRQVISEAIKKYNLENFSFEVIACCSNQNDANIIEIELIKQYNSLASNGFGYNIEIGGNSKIRSDETRKKISANSAKYWLGKKMPKETIDKMIESRKYYRPSEETKIKMSASAKGKNTWMKGRELPEDWVKNMAQAHVGLKRSDETKKKMSAALKGRVSPMKGKRFSEEHKLKLSEAAIKREAAKRNNKK
jgi:group I intron endonuclease